jgi:hypothetical protein
MLGDGNNFNSVVWEADKQGPIFYVYPERINKPMFRLQEFCVKEGCEGSFSKRVFTLSHFFERPCFRIYR